MQENIKREPTSSKLGQVIGAEKTEYHHQIHLRQLQTSMPILMEQCSQIVTKELVLFFEEGGDTITAY